MNTSDNFGSFDEVAKILWPGGDVAVGRRRAITSEIAYLPLPSSNSPRLLLPVGHRAPAAGAITRFQGAGTVTQRLRRVALASAVRSGLAEAFIRTRLFVPDGDSAGDTIEAFLGSALGCNAILAVRLGAPRANRKPVVQVLNSSGRLLGVAKIGVNRLTAELVDREAIALNTVAASQPKTFVAPHLLLHSVWRDFPLIVQAPLPSGRVRGGVGMELLRQVVLDIAATVPSEDKDLAEGPLSEVLSPQLQALPTTCASVALIRAHTLLIESVRGLVVPHGSWHGDLTPWNTGRVNDRVLVWDWERFGGPVPIGFDLLHWVLHVDIVARRQHPRDAALSLTHRAPELLAPLGIRPEAATAVCLAYMLTLGARYLADRQSEVGVEVGNVGSWLVPVLDKYLPAKSGTATSGG